MKGRAEALTAKRRGRPPKAPAVQVNGKRRGRPPKIRTEAAVVEPVAVPTPTAWTRAGEPRQQTARRSVVISLKVAPSLAVAIAQAAQARGITQKQVITSALATAGLPVSPLDLEDRSPRRRADLIRAMATAA